MAYRIGRTLGNLESDFGHGYTRQRLFEYLFANVIGKIPEKDAILFLKGLEKSLVKRYENTKNPENLREYLLQDAAVLAKKISELDSNGKIDSEATIRTMKYERTLALRQHYGLAAQIAALAGDKEALSRIIMYANDAEKYEKSELYIVEKVISEMANKLGRETVSDELQTNGRLPLNLTEPREEDHGFV